MARSSATWADPPRARRVNGMSKLAAEISEHQSGRSAEKKSAPRPWWVPCKPKTAVA